MSTTGTPRISRAAVALAVLAVLAAVLSVPALRPAAARVSLAASSRPASRPSTPHPAHPRRAARCTRPTPTSAAGYRVAMSRIALAGDATLSVQLPSGRVAWIYADTFVPGVGMPHSTVVMQDRGCFTPTRRQFLPDDRDGTFWWPAAATALPGGHVLVTAGDGYGSAVRAAVAREVGGVLVFDHWLRHWPDGGATRVIWGAGLLVDRGRLWVYGTRTRRPLLGRELLVANIPLAGLASGTGWTVDHAPVWGASPHGVDTTVSAYRDGRGYHVITLQDGVYGAGPLVSLDAPRPDGPFTVHRLLTYSREHQLRYNAEVHPHARITGGALLVTVNNNWPADDRRLHPLDTYRSSWFAVPTHRTG